MSLVTSPFVLEQDGSYYDLRFVSAWWVDDSGDWVFARFLPPSDSESQFVIRFPRDQFESQMQAAVDA